jgi:hypothetical protein
LENDVRERLLRAQQVLSFAELQYAQNLHIRQENNQHFLREASASYVGLKKKLTPKINLRGEF